MLPDLGKYVWTVLGAYGAGLGLMAALIVVTLWQGARTRRALRAAEARLTGERLTGERFTGAEGKAE